MFDFELGDPIGALRVVAVCNQMRVYPPPNVMKFIANAFDRKLKAAHHADLDDILGLKGVGSGTNNPIATDLKARVVERIMKNMQEVSALWKCTLVKASAIEASHLKMLREKIKSEEVIFDIEYPKARILELFDYDEGELLGEYKKEKGKFIRGKKGMESLLKRSVASRNIKQITELKTRYGERYYLRFSEILKIK